MTRRTTYITRTAALLPNAPVANDDVEAVLGQVGDRPSRARRIVQRNNGIRRRFYVIDPGTGVATHSNASLTASAVRGLVDEHFALEDISVLACGTSNPDQLLPNHAVMVHGELGTPVCEVVATSGVCVSGMTALKYAWMSVASGDAKNAIATGSEVASLGLRAHNYDGERQQDVAALEAQPGLAFEKDFLRWMLSDGAGAVLLEPQPRKGLNLRVEWIDVFSYAHAMPACMYMGAEKEADGTLRGWMRYDVAGRDRNSVFAIKQDVRLLNESVIEYTVVKPLRKLLERRELTPAGVTWLLPHISSEYFRKPVADGFARAGLALSPDKWFTNLDRVGNTGSASVYLMLDELARSGRLKEGDRLLCFVPESGRFSSSFMALTVVKHA